MQKTQSRLERWLLELQDFDFTVSYAFGEGPLLTVPDALHRFNLDTSTILCPRCLEVVVEIQKDGRGLKTIIAAQTDEWGHLEEKAVSESQ